MVKNQPNLVVASSREELEEELSNHQEAYYQTVDVSNYIKFLRRTYSVAACFEFHKNTGEVIKYHLLKKDDDNLGCRIFFSADPNIKQFSYDDIQQMDRIINTLITLCFDWWPGGFTHNYSYRIEQAIKFATDDYKYCHPDEDGYFPCDGCPHEGICSGTSGIGLEYDVVKSTFVLFDQKEDINDWYSEHDL